MKNPFVIFAVMIVVGVGLEWGLKTLHYRMTKTHYKEHHFTLGKYLFLLLFPLLGVFTSVNLVGLGVGAVFLKSAILGTVMEGLVGFSYHKVIGQKLWTYHKYSFGGYTSWLSVPVWGLAGVFFWLMMNF